jgi:hypothetical protein
MMISAAVERLVVRMTGRSPTDTGDSYPHQLR